MIGGSLSEMFLSLKSMEKTKKNTRKTQCVDQLRTLQRAHILTPAVSLSGRPGDRAAPVLSAPRPAASGASPLPNAQPRGPEPCGGAARCLTCAFSIQ